jgi:hypothetical protein
MARFLSARVVVAKGFTPTLGETTDGTYVVEIAKKLLKIHKSEGSGYCRIFQFRMRGMTGKYAVHFKICCFSGKFPNQSFIHADVDCDPRSETCERDVRDGVRQHV